MRLVRKNIVVKSGIRDGYFEFTWVFVRFLLGLGLGSGLGFVLCTYVQKLGLGLWLGFYYTRTIDCM